MDLQSIATESQTLRSTIRDLRSVIATDKERLERHEGELKAALLRLDELESEAQVAFAAIRAPVAPTATEAGRDAEWEGARLNKSLDEITSIFGEPNQVAAE